MINRGDGSLFCAGCQCSTCNHHGWLFKVIREECKKDYPDGGCMGGCMGDLPERGFYNPEQHCKDYEEDKNA